MIAGKAHPADEGGKQLIQQMVRFADDPAVRHRIVFLPDYDMELARALVQGCDVWLNNPLRPLEACGTSGMKSALNGGLNLSVKDGWWDEWSDGENGWEIPSADGVADSDRRDELESAALYELIEPRWRRCSTTPGRTGCRPVAGDGRAHPRPRAAVQASRMVRDYVTACTCPLRGRRACSRKKKAGTPFAAARELAAWKHRVSRPGKACASSMSRRRTAAAGRATGC